MMKYLKSEIRNSLGIQLWSRVGDQIRSDVKCTHLISSWTQVPSDIWGSITDQLKIIFTDSSEEV